MLTLIWYVDRRVSPRDGKVWFYALVDPDPFTWAAVVEVASDISPQAALWNAIGLAAKGLGETSLLLAP